MSAQPPSGDVDFPDDDRRRLRAGVVLALLGKVLELSHGLAFVIGRFLYEGPVHGLFIIGYTLCELVARLLHGGFGDAAVWTASRHFGRDEQLNDAGHVQMYRGLATCVWIPLVLGLVLVAGIYFAAPLLHAAVWPDKDPVLIDNLRIVAWIIPLSVLVRIPIEATKARLTLKWVVFVAEGVLPGLTLGLVVLFAVIGLQSTGLAWALVAAYLLCLPLAVIAFARCFSLRATASAAIRLQVDAETLRFAVPQGINMMLNYGLTRIDALMLSLWVPASLVSLYATCAENLRSVRAAHTSFAALFAPLATRYKARGNVAGLEKALVQSARAAAALSLCIAFAIMMFHRELLVGFSQFPADTLFPWLLVWAPLTSCLFGLAGNVLLMTGHPRTLLKNSAALTVLNIGLNIVLIRYWGLLGAALATAVSATLIAVLQLYQIKKLEGVRLPLGSHNRTLLFALPALVLVALLSSTDWHYALYAWSVPAAIVAKAVVLLGALALFAGLVLLGPGATRRPLSQLLGRSG